MVNAIGAGQCVAAASEVHVTLNAASEAEPRQHSASAASATLEDVTNTVRSSPIASIQQFFRAIGGGLRDILLGVRNLFSSCTTAAAQTGAGGPTSSTASSVEQTRAGMMAGLWDVMERSSAKLVKQAFDPAASLAHLGQDLRGLSAALLTLSASDVQLTERIQELFRRPFFSGQNVNEFQASQALNLASVDASHDPQVRLGLMQYLDQVREIVQAVAEGQGDTQTMLELRARTATWFQDPMQATLKATLAREANRASATGMYQAPKSGPSLLGVRFTNPIRTDNVPTRHDGVKYLAHFIQAGTGQDVGLALSYPKEDELPEFLQLLRDTEVAGQIVLASPNDMLDRNLPFYFAKSGTYGDVQVTSQQRELHNFGPLRVQEYELSSAGMSWPVLHVENWPDHAGIPAEPLVQFARYLHQTYGDEVTRMATHCVAGLGRTGTLQAVVGMLVHGVTPETMIRAQRIIRSQDMVQGDAQLATVVRAWRIIQAEGPTQGVGGQDEAIYANAAFDRGPPSPRPNSSSTLLAESGEVSRDLISAEAIYENVRTDAHWRLPGAALRNANGKADDSSP